MKTYMRVAVLLFAFVGILPVQAQTLPTPSACCVPPDSPPPASLPSPPPVPPGVISVEQSVQQGWNFLVNRLKDAINVRDYFGAWGQFTEASWATQTVYRWNAFTQKWKFWSPQLTVEENVAYVAEQGYEILEQIGPGGGYWLNSRYNTNLPRVKGKEFVWTAETYAGLPSGFNMIGGSGSPSQFNRAMSSKPVQQCEIPMSFTTLWAWETGSVQWIFYAPQLEATGGSAAWDYTQAKGYIDGSYWGFDGFGFWVNKPDVQAESIQKADCYSGRG